METMFTEDFEENIPGYFLESGRTKNIDELLNYIRDYSVGAKKIDTLILAYHASRNSMRLGFFEKLTSDNVDNIFAGYEDCFAEDARINDAFARLRFQRKTYRFAVAPRSYDGVGGNEILDGYEEGKNLFLIVEPDEVPES